MIGAIGSGRVCAGCHEGAIYLHRGGQYVEKGLDRDDHKGWVRGVKAIHYTRSL